MQPVACQVDEWQDAGGKIVETVAFMVSGTTDW